MQLYTFKSSTYNKKVVFSPKPILSSGFGKVQAPGTIEQELVLINTRSKVQLNFEQTLRVQLNNANEMQQCLSRDISELYQSLNQNKTYKHKVS